jgi:hypothetical protein
MLVCAFLSYDFVCAINNIVNVILQFHYCTDYLHLSSLLRVMSEVLIARIHLGPYTPSV